MSFTDTAGLERELAQNLKFGRAFVNGAGGVAVLSDCTLVLARADGAELKLTAHAVFVSDAAGMCGVGLELRPFGAEVLAQLQSFASGAVLAPPAADAPQRGALGSQPAEAVEDAAESHDEPAANVEPGDDADDDETVDDEEGAELEEGEDAEGAGGPSRDVQRQMRQERLRKLSQVEQQKIARSGDLSDRVMLERLYGKAVWEGLLHNPKLTVPEVARMAQKGTMPRPMVELILDNASWVQQGSVRRALLGNPRVSSEGVLKILRATPKHELKVITKSSAYAAPVREAARKLLKA